MDCNWILIIRLFSNSQKTKTMDLEIPDEVSEVYDQIRKISSKNILRDYLEYDDVFEFDNRKFTRFQGSLIRLILNPPISFTRHEIYLSKNQNHIVFRDFDILVGFFSKEDTVIEISINSQKFEQKIIANVFTYPICNIVPTRDLNISIICLVDSGENKINAIYATVSNISRKFFWNNNLYTKTTHENKSVRINFSFGSCWIISEDEFRCAKKYKQQLPNFYSDLIYQNETKRNFGMKFGLKFELMEYIWNPRNIKKFKYLDPEIFGDLDLDSNVDSEFTKN